MVYGEGVLTAAVTGVMAKAPATTTALVAIAAIRGNSRDFIVVSVFGLGVMGCC